MPYIRKLLCSLICFCFLLSSACREAQEPVDPVRAPVIANLTIQPEIVCVGSVAQVSFMVSDPNGDRITWTARVNTTVHGNLERSTGTESSGTIVSVGFKAPTGGNHRHRITLKVEASDEGGAEAEPAELSFFVFSTCA